MATTATTKTTAKRSTAAGKTATKKAASGKGATKSSAKSTTKGATKSTTKGTTKSSGSTKSSAKRASAPRLDERQPQVLAKDAVYALAGVADEAVTYARELPTKLRTEAPEKLRELRTDAPQRVSAAQGNLKATVVNQRAHYEAQLRDLRDRAAKEAGTRLQHFEERFDQRAKAGAEVVDRVRKDERVAAVEQQLGRVLEQSGNTRMQVKAAITSLRKTVETAVAAGRSQADTAKSQVKAAVTSARRTAETTVDAGEKLAS